MALDRLKKRGGSRKGKLEPSERERVEEFIARVKGGELQVTKGELAKAMRLYVCPGMERSQEFFEKLVSRRGLNKAMKHLLLPRRRKEEDANSEHSSGASGTKRMRSGAAMTPGSVASGGYGGTRSGKRQSRSPGPEALMGGGEMGFGGGYPGAGFGYGQNNPFSSPLHPDALSFGGGGNMGMMGFGGTELGMGGGASMGMMGLGNSSSMHNTSNGGLPGLMGNAGGHLTGAPSFHVPGGGGSNHGHPPPMSHGGHMHPGMGVQAGAPPSRAGGGRTASEAAAAASAALASSLGLGAPLTKPGGGSRPTGPGGPHLPEHSDDMPPPARAPVMQPVAAPPGSAAGGPIPPSSQGGPGKGMRRDWSLESLERLADVASIESSEIDALHQMLESRQGGRGSDKGGN